MGRQELFHGTVANIKDEVVRPAGRGSAGSKHGSVGYRWGQRSDEHAFATETEGNAWKWAQNTAWDYKAPEPRQRVYKVAAGPEAKIGVYHPDHPRWKGNPPPGEFDSFPEWVSRKGFNVTEQIDTKPGHQGTFPSVNWNTLKTRGWSSDANHPDWDTVRYGAPMTASRQQYEDAMWDDEKDRNVGWPPKLEASASQTPGQGALFGRQWQG